MEKYKLNAQKRTITGKKVKKLRVTGILPANIFGKKIKSTAIQLNQKEFEKIYKKAGETGIVELRLDKADEVRPVLISHVQVDPVRGGMIHADLYQVSLKEKIKTMVPVAIIGQAAAVVNKEGLLLTILDEIEVECLPTDLPDKIEIDVSKLAKVDQEIQVKDIKVDRTKVTVLTEANLTICKIGSLITEEQKKELEAEAAAKAAAAAEKAAATATAGPAPAGAAPTPETKPEAAKPEAKKEAPATQPKK